MFLENNLLRMLTAAYSACPGDIWLVQGVPREFEYRDGYAVIFKPKQQLPIRYTIDDLVRFGCPNAKYEVA